jgi:hypothetical protein
LLLVSVPVLAQEPNAQDDFCKACVDPDAPPPASIPNEEEARAAEHERRAAEDAAKRARIHRLKLAGGLLLGVGSAATVTGAITGLTVLTDAVGCIFNSSPACTNPSNAPFNATVVMFAIGAPMVIAGITVLGVASHEKKRLGNPDTITTPARELVSSLGVSPVASNGTTTGGVLQWSLRF